MDEMILKEYESPMAYILLAIMIIYFSYKIWVSWRIGSKHKQEYNKLVDNTNSILQS
jgi:hypothetical protein